MGRIYRSVKITSIFTPDPRGIFYSAGREDEGVEEVVEQLKGYKNPTSQMRLIRMHGRRDISYADLHNNYDWKQVSAMIAELDQSPWMELDV